MVNSVDGRFVWYELLTTDVRSATAFYASVVGWRARDVSMPGLAYNLFLVGDNPVSAVMNLPEQTLRAGATPCWMGYISVTDVDLAVAQISRLGGVVRVPPTTIPNISRFSVVADPQMATFTLVTGFNAREAKLPGPEMSGRVDWHELFAADWEAAFVFYNDLFGWKKEDTDAGATSAYQRFSAGGETIGAMSNKPPEMPLPFWLYYFNVDEIEAAANRVAAGGGQVLYGPTEVAGGALMVNCRDPQGAVFGLLSRPKRKPVGYFIPAAKQT
jgi:uncharacterized protein